VHPLSKLLSLHQLFRSQLHNLSQRNKLLPHPLLQLLRAQLQHKQLLSQLQYWQLQAKQPLNHFAELLVALLQAWKHH
jgi:hypothetical protein